MGKDIRRPLFQRIDQYGSTDGRVGELARVMARKYGDQSFKEGEKDNIEEEIADVLWVLLCIANQTGVDVTAALQKSMEKKTKRDSKRHINNPKLNDHGGE